MPTTNGSTVHVPARATADESYQILGACSAIEKDAAARVVDAARCTMFGPIGVALLALALARRRTRGLPDLEFIEPNADDVREFLREVGFARFLTAARADENPPVGTLQMRHLFRLVPAYTADIANLLSSRVRGTDDDVAYLIELCLNELLQNVFEHADSKEGCFVQTRWYSKTGNVRIAVVDGGIGIPAALRREYVADLQRKRDADVVIEAVTRKGITSRRGNKQGGFGLKLLHEAAVERGGKLIVVSQTAKVVFKSSGIQRPRSSPFRGTAIELDFRPDAAVRPIEQGIF
jgi:signal transduction histidine kinase